jgi:hypothetical protein
MFLGRANISVRYATELSKSRRLERKPCGISLIVDLGKIEVAAQERT